MRPFRQCAALRHRRSAESSLLRGIQGSTDDDLASTPRRPRAMLLRAMDEAMSEKSFDLLADRTLTVLVDRLAELDDVEADLSQGVLTVKFEDGRRYVVNSHRAARQIWMAAESSAWHFDWDGARWISTKSKDELFGLLEAVVGKKLGRAVALR